MESKLDIILLGATGFTGKLTAQNLALICKESPYTTIKWGIAGRSKQKMRDFLTELESDVPILVCDIVKNESNIIEVTKRARVLMNATGPCTLLSAAVVKACIATGTHYVDLSAELYVRYYFKADKYLSNKYQIKKLQQGNPIDTRNVFLSEFFSHMIDIYRGYNKAAEQANVLIVPSCGFACIPVVAGLTQLERNFKGTLHSVECYTVLEIPIRANFPFPGHNNSLIHYGTWASLVHELRNFRRYNELKKQTFPDIRTVPAELNKPFFHRHKGRFWYPYPGPEYAVIEQSQHYQSKRGKTPYYFKIYTTMPLFIHFLMVVPVFFIYYFLCRFACFRKLVWTFPRVFTLGLASHKGPSAKMRNDTKFSFTLNGKGWGHDSNFKSAPDKKLTVKVSGSDPGYQTTSICFVLAAITILTERTKMPSGGVLSTGVVYSDTEIAEKLVKYGVSIERLSE